MAAVKLKTYKRFLRYTLRERARWSLLFRWLRLCRSTAFMDATLCDYHSHHQLLILSYLLF
jgi:hypothetical protein